MMVIMQSPPIGPNWCVRKVSMHHTLNPTPHIKSDITLNPTIKSDITIEILYDTLGGGNKDEYKDEYKD